MKYINPKLRLAIILSILFCDNLATAAGVPISSYVGTWSTTTKYARGQVVSYNGLIYLSLKASNLNHIPNADTANWQILGTNVQGPQGIPGPQGAQGNPGVAGPAGPSDLTATLGQPCSYQDASNHIATGVGVIYTIKGDPGPTISCAASEDSRYIDLVQVVVDKTTNLMWEKKSAAGTGDIHDVNMPFT